MIGATNPALLPLLWLLSFGALAGGAGMGTAAPGELRPSSPAPAIGSKVDLQLVFKPLRDFQSVVVRFQSGDCASISPADAQRTVTNLVHDREVELHVMAQVAKSTPCLITAQVLEAESEKFRIGAIYGVTLNPVKVVGPVQTAGTTSTGRATVDVTVGGSARPRQ